MFAEFGDNVAFKMSHTLRRYQSDGINGIFRHWREGKRSILFQMPTGTGKTVLFSEIVRRGFIADKKILIVVHRKELIEQITNKLKSLNIDLGLIVADRKSDYSKLVQVASIQTLSRREHPDSNLIIIDECHHAKADSYKKLWDIYPEAKFLGVTATPVRLSGEGFEDLFDIMVESPPVSYFIQNNFLVPIKQLVCANPDLSKVKKRQGDYITSALSDVMLDNSLMSNLLESYQKHALNKSTIVFAVDVEHSKSIVDRFRNAGIQSEHIDSQTSKAERASIIKSFKEKQIKVISNVEIITEGFDFPECEAVQLARPTKSLALYLQMVGRVMRTAEGKSEGIVLDNAGLWLEHGLAIIDRTWSLKGKGSSQGFGKREMALDEDGVIREVNRSYPFEVEGLQLIPLTEELEQLLSFETALRKARTFEYKALYAYHNYLEILQTKNRKITKSEFNYIRRRLNKVNKEFPPEKRFHEGFWYHEEHRHF